MNPLDRISGYAHVALRYGLEEAIFLDSIMFWYKENKANDRNFQDGRWWTYNSVAAFGELFPWWSGKQIRRIVGSCVDKGAILSANYSPDQRDRTLWYTPSDELLALYGMAGTGKCICPNGQMEMPNGANESAQTGKCNIDTCYKPCNNPLPPKQNTPEAVDAIFDDYAQEDLELRQRLRDFQECRRKKKKPLHTDRAAKILIRKLDVLSGGDRRLKLALLDNAILHSWDSVYPLKTDEMPPGAVSPDDGGVRPEGGRWL